MIKRLPINIKIYKGQLKLATSQPEFAEKYGDIDTFIKLECEKVHTVSSTIPSRVIASAAGVLSKEGIQLGDDHFAELTVTYSREKDYTNGGRYFSQTALKLALNNFLEAELLRELTRDGCVDKKYLEKRKLTPAQREAAMKNFKKSPLVLKKGAKK